MCAVVKNLLNLINLQLEDHWGYESLTGSQKVMSVNGYGSAWLLLFATVFTPSTIATAGLPYEFYCGTLEMSTAKDSINKYSSW